MLVKGAPANLFPQIAANKQRLPWLGVGAGANVMTTLTVAQQAGIDKLALGGGEVYEVTAGGAGFFVHWSSYE